MRKVRKAHVSTKNFILRQGIMIKWVSQIPPGYRSAYVMRLKHKSDSYEYEIQMNFQVYQSEKRKQ